MDGNKIKKFSNWPTIPQLYIKGEFIGGCDIITEMAMSGELDDLPEQAFYLVGNIEEVKAKAEKINSEK